MSFWLHCRCWIRIFLWATRSCQCQCCCFSIVHHHSDMRLTTSRLTTPSGTWSHTRARAGWMPWLSCFTRSVCENVVFCWDTMAAERFKLDPHNHGCDLHSDFMRSETEWRFHANKSGWVIMGIFRWIVSYFYTTDAMVSPIHMLNIKVLSHPYVPIEMQHLGYKNIAQISNKWPWWETDLQPETTFSWLLFSWDKFEYASVLEDHFFVAFRSLFFAGFTVHVDDFYSFDAPIYLWDWPRNFTSPGSFSALSELRENSRI